MICTVGVAEAVLTRSGVDGIRVTAIELTGDIVIGVANHLCGLRLVRLCAMFEDVVRNVELDNRKPRTSLIFVRRTVVRATWGVGKADLGSPRSINSALRSQFWLRSRSDVSSCQRKAGDSDDTGKTHANRAGRPWSKTMTSVHNKKPIYTRR